MKPVAVTQSLKRPSARFQYFIIGLSVLALCSLFAVKATSESYGSDPGPDMKLTIPAGDGEGTAARPTGATGVADVVEKALAFKALLNGTQQTTLQLTYTNALARKWSNLPCGAGCRNGIQFGTLSSAQLTAALEVIKAALGSNANDGYDEFIQNRLAEAYLHANGGGNGYDSTLRWIAFLNTPTATGPWMLQFGGHHYAANIAFNNGHVIGATPFFQGLEPLSFTWNGTTYASLTDEHDALTAMLASLSSSELTTAKLTTTFSDITMSPGETNGGNGSFPTTKAGLACSGLTTAQKNLVLAAIGHYVNDMDEATATAVMAKYTAEIDGTYIAFTGNGTTGNATSFLNANSNYVRIDGPSVWIELACQNGVVIQGQIHYHTIWRDHDHDYGVDLTGGAIDQSGGTAIQGTAANTNFSIYPNPATTQISMTLPAEVNRAAMKIINITTGQVITSEKNKTGKQFQVNVSGLAAGMYLLKIEDAGSSYTSKFAKQ